MTLLEKAIEIALKAHAGQTDKAGEPYILHPLRVMGMMATEHERVVAVLHDVLEDSDILYGELFDEGVPIELLDALDALTKRKGEDYRTYIDRVALNPLAVKVKLADIADNLMADRVSRIPASDADRLFVKYQSARHRLRYGIWREDAGISTEPGHG